MHTISLKVRGEGGDAHTHKKNPSKILKQLRITVKKVIKPYLKLFNNFKKVLRCPRLKRSNVHQRMTGTVFNSTKNLTGNKCKYAVIINET